MARFSSLAGDFGIGQALAHDLRDGKVKAVAVIHVLAVVVAEALLVEVAKQMERFNRNIGALEPALQQTPKVFHSVCMNLTVNIFHSVVNNLMHVLRAEPFVRKQRIAVDRGARRDMLSDFALKRLTVAARNNASPNRPAMLNDAHDNCFVLAASPSDSAGVFVRVHVARFAADESLINFDVAGELARVLILKREADTLKHEPRGLLSDLEAAMNLPRANAVLGVREEPHSAEPLVEADRRVLKDRSNLDAELCARMPSLALPHAARWHKANFVRAAVRAYNAVRPAAGDYIGKAIVRVREVEDCFLKCLWLVRFISHSRILAETA